MKDSISISLPGVLKRKLDKLTKQDQVNRSDVVREALREDSTRRGVPAITLLLSG